MAEGPGILPDGYNSQEFIDLHRLREEAANEDQTEVNQTSREDLAPTDQSAGDNGLYGQPEQEAVNRTPDIVLAPNDHDADDNGGHGQNRQEAQGLSGGPRDDGGEVNYRRDGPEHDNFRRNYRDVLNALTERDSECRAFQESRNKAQKELERLSLEQEELVRQHNDQLTDKEQEIKKLRQENAILVDQHAQQNQIIMAQRAKIRDMNKRLIELTAELNDKKKSTYPDETVYQSEDKPKPDHGNTQDDSDYTSFQVAKRARFVSIPCKPPQCKNCGMVFGGGRDAWHKRCNFHMAKPQSYQVWRRNADAEGKDRHCLYWPCCHTYSRYTPIGCKCLKHHVVIDYN